MSIDTPEEPEKDFAMAVGERTHAAIARMLDGGVPADRANRVIAIGEATNAVLTESPVVHPRAKAAKMSVATGVACYLSFFLPPRDWRYVASEVVLGRGRADLVFEHGDGRVLVDEVKTGRGRVNETKARPQIDRLLAGGAERWGRQFVGVRLCALSEPQVTRLFVPGKRRSVLVNASNVAAEVRR